MAYSLTGLSDTDISQNKPIKATQGQQIRDNIIAVAAGTLNAPKVVGNALDLSPTTFTFTGTAGGITDIDARAKTLLFLIGADLESTGAVTVDGGVQMRASNDNGSTWGSFFTIESAQIVQNRKVSTNPSAVLDTETGIVDCSGGITVNLGKTGIDAVQLKTFNGDVMAGRAVVMVIGGIT